MVWGMTTFSVLICTYNRAELLDMALEALVNRTTEKPDQVVVVNGGDEGADVVVRRYQKDGGMQMELVKTVNKNLAASRNVGLPHCTGDIVAMTDDDAEVFPDWVTKMKQTHEYHPEAGGVGGAVIGAESENSLRNRIANLAVFSSPGQSGYVRTIAGVNVSYKRAALDQAGLQDEILFRGEDVDFNWRIKKLGYEIYYSPEIRVIHHHRPTINGLINQFYMYGRAYYLVRSKWPEMYCVYPHNIGNIKAFKRLIYFFISTLSDPFNIICKLNSLCDRITALPISYIIHIAWKSGIIYQKIRCSLKYI
jgi:glycosyltransferase involved in cell wall biosynthesis